MASSKVMASAAPANPDLPRQTSPSSPPLHSSSLLGNSDHNRSFGSMNMEEILKNIYSDSDSFPLDNNAGSGGGGVGNKTVDEVWSEIVRGGGGEGNVGAGGPAMTLEDFLTKAGAVREEDVRVPPMHPPPPPPPAAAGIGVERIMNVAAVPATAHFTPPGVCMPNGGFGMEFGNGMVAAVGASCANGGSGRGKRRAAIEEVPLDKATQQKQRRMIKNRESAARSRERKQAYTVELESLVTQLEEENARLLKEEAELNKERYKQLMENLIPVVEQRRPPRALRRVRSMTW